jgi:hypothetical protein
MKIGPGFIFQRIKKGLHLEEVTRTTDSTNGGGQQISGLNGSGKNTKK